MSNETFFLGVSGSRFFVRQEASPSEEESEKRYVNVLKMMNNIKKFHFLRKLRKMQERYQFGEGNQFNHHANMSV